MIKSVLLPVGVVVAIIHFKDPSKPILGTFSICNRAELVNLRVLKLCMMI
jgi:hypothetical protein